MPKGSKQRHITLSVEASRHARFSRAPQRAWRRYRDILAGPEAVFGGHRGPASGSGSDVSIRRLDHPGLADLAGENLKGADVVLQRGGGTPPVFPDFRQGLQVPAPEAVHGVNQKAWLLIAENSQTGFAAGPSYSWAALRRDLQQHFQGAPYPETFYGRIAVVGYL